LAIVYVRIVISNTVIIIIIILIFMQEFCTTVSSARTLQFPTHPAAFLPVTTVSARELWSLWTALKTQ
jgi:hypothetical protein